MKSAFCTVLSCTALWLGTAWGAPEATDETLVESPSMQGAYLHLPTRIDEDPTEILALSSNEPMYLVVGGKGDSTGKLQFSFQYRIFDVNSGSVEAWPWLEKLHFAYTQTSVWDMLGSSNPLKDSTYRPSVYWQQVDRRGDWGPDFLRIGYEHESNGKAEDESRGMDSLFVFPAWILDLADGRNLLVGSKLYLPLNTSEHNEDIHDYRGFVDLQLHYGRSDGWVSTATLRHGSKGGSAELTFSHPFRKPLFARTGGYFYMEVFHGYGETLIGYDKKTGTQFRIGVAVVR